MQKSVIVSICSYSMSCNAGFRKRPWSYPNKCVSPIWNMKKWYFFIYCKNSVSPMNVARKRAKYLVKNIFLRQSLSPEPMYISSFSALTVLNLKALASIAWKTASRMTLMQQSVIGSISAYLISCNAGFRKHPISCPHECVYLICCRKHSNATISQ